MGSYALDEFLEENIEVTKSWCDWLELTGGKGSNFFLFADNAAFADRSPLDVQWTSGKANLVRLTD